MRFGKAYWRDFARGTEREWLVANGLGGYASSTLIGANTRRYHGLLVAALLPPVRRTLYLAKLDERVETPERTYILAANLVQGGPAEGGHIHLQQVRFDPFPTFIYSFGDVTLKKTVFMIYGENTTVVFYRIYNGAAPAVLRLTPLVNCRDFHWLARRGQVDFSVRFAGRGVVEVRPTKEAPPLRLACSAGRFEERGDWYYGLYYPEEERRGFEAAEDHFLPGDFVVEVPPEEELAVTFLATLEEVFSLEGEALLQCELARQQELLERAGYKSPLARRLVLAADAFIVERRSAGGKTIIAGYHWFNDWGRDAMIALPGLTLVTGRFDDARAVLLTFARHARDGLLPNMFADGGEILYNTVDASLWFFWAAWKYLRYTGDEGFVRRELYPVMEEIAARYVEGTHFNIRVDGDGLLSAGSGETQLTWMDAKVDGWVVTPRHGKAVEVNALWYNALGVLGELAARFGKKFPYGELMSRQKESFWREFWYEGGGYFYDVVGPQGKDSALRPNQVIALALPYSMVDAPRGRRVLRRVWRELYATYGLRTLSPAHPAYRGVYSGDRWQRDGAYHQGTVWSWLIGPFVTAWRRVHHYSPASRLQAARLLSPFIDHLREYGVGYIGEIFDGDEPLFPRGCIAQAWGVAEVLRAYVEEVLEKRP